MSHFGVKPHGHGSLKKHDQDFSLIAWAILSSLVFALAFFFFVIF